MISSISIIYDGRDPNGIKAHALNIVKIVDDSAIPTSTIVTKIIATIVLSIIPGKSVGEELIDGSFLPLLLVGSSNKCSDAENKEE